MKLKNIFIPLVLFLMIWGAEEFLRRKVGGLAGYFPFAETWTLDISKTELLNIIELVKIQDATLLPPDDSLSINDNYLDYWKVNFYYEDSREIVKVWITSSYEDSTKTILLLDSFKGLEENDNYRKINRDFWYLANKRQINKFENVILRPILDMADVSE